MRLVILIHRYVGIGIGLIMAMWCASGVVMMYVSYPQLDEARRIEALPRLSLAECCSLQRVAVGLDVNVYDDFSVEMVDRTPVLLATQAGGPRMAFDLKSGERVNKFSAEQAVAVAQAFAAKFVPQANPVYGELLERDQWTVSGAFNRDRPLHKIRMEDAAGTELYISSSSGRVVQETTARARFWNWLGAVPHWLYPTALRQHPALWSQVVIWLSVVGGFLTIVGIYLGIVQWRATRNGRWSPYRGAHLWHHLGGLFFGLFTLTWVVSGLVSMSPWGLFEGGDARAEQERAVNLWIDGRTLVDSVDTYSRSNARGVARLESAPFDGRLYLLASGDGAPLRVTSNTLQPVPVTAMLSERAAELIADGAKRSAVELLAEGDEYYYSGHDKRSLPVYRFALDDSQRTRYYLHPDTLQIVDKIDANRRWYRWLFEGLHRWDFSAALRQRPLWDLWVLPLLLGVTVVCFTGVYVGYRRLFPRRRL